MNLTTFTVSYQLVIANGVKLPFLRSLNFCKYIHSILRYIDSYICTIYCPSESCLLFCCDCSFIRELLNLCSHRWHELTDFPGPNPARSTLRPLLGLKPGLSSHKLTRSHTLNPGLPLESPGALPTKHTDAPQDQERTLWGGHWWLTIGHRILMDTTWLKILSEPFQWIEIPGVQVPTLRGYDSAGLQWGHEMSL